MTSAFEEIPARVPLIDVFALYGLHPNRAGFVCCPLHSENTGSLKVYPDSWYCYGCHTGGDAVKLVSLVDNITPIIAARKISDVFNLGIFFDKPLTNAERNRIESAARKRAEDNRAVEAFDDWYWHTWRALLWYKRILDELCATYAPKDINDDIEDYAFLLHESTRIDGWIDRLDFGEYSEIVDFYRNHRKELKGIDEIRQGRCVANTTA